MTTTPTPHVGQGAAELARRIATGEATSSEVVEEHIARIERVNPRLNAITQPAFEQARCDAQSADKAVAAGKPLGSLHGVPVTIKDCFATVGFETTLGIPNRSNGPTERDAPLVSRLRNAGAIVIGKTNIPQGMLLHECDNPVHGRTLHPQSDSRSPGGSSGGEAAIVAAGGSPLGLASDLGGSIRQPAAACGVCGFKPSSYRLSSLDSDRVLAGMRTLPIAPGPIAPRVEDLDLAMRAMLDTTITPRQTDERDRPWRDFRQVDVARLQIAWWTDDSSETNSGGLPVAVGVRRVVEQAAEKLAALGADVRRVTPPATDEMLSLYFGVVSADGMRALSRALRGVAVDPQIAKQLRLACLPRGLRGLLGPALRLAGQPKLANLLAWTGPRSADEYWQLTAAAEAFRASYWSKLDATFAEADPRGAAGPVDVVLTPPYSLPALRHGTALRLIMAASHCFLANLLDAPAGVIPFGSVTEVDEQQELARGRSRWQLGERYATANARGSVGLPLGVQAMAPSWQDEVALAVLSALESFSGGLAP